MKRAFNGSSAIDSLAMETTAPLRDSTAAFSAKPVTVDAQNSVIEWTGSKIIGNSHRGTIGVKEGEVVMRGGNIGSAKIVVDMLSIINLDLADPEYNKQLVGHLKSEDFFNVEKFPTATIAIRDSVVEQSGNFKLKADLTIKGETHPIEFHAKLSQDGKSVDVSLGFDRTLWNIRYGSGKFFANLGDKIISDKIELKIKIKFLESVLSVK